MNDKIMFPPYPTQYSQGKKGTGGGALFNAQRDSKGYKGTPHLDTHGDPITCPLSKQYFVPLGLIWVYPNKSQCDSIGYTQSSPKMIQTGNLQSNSKIIICIAYNTVELPIRAVKNFLRLQYFISPGQGITIYIFQLSITEPPCSIIGYCINIAIRINYSAGPK